ncbi:hypothetical protein WISP_109099 [Willisornis vidua]|uniref:Endonuclease/exonuclease/phosphatase domain-containing protein n=1 Tax=Willisornis vidua TaxID=1566151 RepID=A0ABQ9CW91_9PASS|nr:hypothetical protein WISP_109099 [Willisornis vidua]
MWKICYSLEKHQNLMSDANNRVKSEFADIVYLLSFAFERNVAVSRGQFKWKKNVPKKEIQFSADDTGNIVLLEKVITYQDQSLLMPLEKKGTRKLRDQIPLSTFQELEATVQQENYDVVAVTETWWDDSHDWSAAMEGYKLFRKDRQDRRGGAVALYVREFLDSVELEVINNKVECLWTRIRGKANKADILVGVSYRPPNQDDEGSEQFYKHLADVSRLAPLVLVGDFNLSDTFWELSIAEKRQSRRFLECIEDKFPASAGK